MPVCCLVDEWESKAFSDCLASRKSGGCINHYWMIKNMLALLLENMTTKWNGVWDMEHGLRASILQADMQLKNLERNFNLRKYSIFQTVDNEGNTGDKTQGVKGGTSAAGANSHGILQEQGGLPKNLTPVKRGHRFRRNIPANLWTSLAPVQF